MKYNPDIHHRRSIRLKGYDYSQAGLYFVTICTQNRECIFGEIVDDRRGAMHRALNEYGRIGEKEWIKTSEIRPNIHLDVFVIMPNHIHGIIRINGGLVGAYRNTPLLEKQGFQYIYAPDIAPNNDSTGTTMHHAPTKQRRITIRPYEDVLLMERL